MHTLLKALCSMVGSHSFETGLVGERTLSPVSKCAGMHTFRCAPWPVEERCNHQHLPNTTCSSVSGVKNPEGKSPTRRKDLLITEYHTQVPAIKRWRLMATNRVALEQGVTQSFQRENACCSLLGAKGAV